MEVSIAAYFFKATNGRTQMVYKNMKFYQQPEGKDRIRWRCTKRGCRAFYFTIGGVIVRSQEFHNHDGNKYLDFDQFTSKYRIV